MCAVVFCKQKTAYEMRISDWSSDVCSSDLGSSALIFHLLGMDRESRSQVTTEELHLIVAEASRSGVIEESERAIISGVVRLSDRPAREVMTPRTEVDWIDADADADAIRARLLESPHT